MSNGNDSDMTFRGTAFLQLTVSMATYVEISARYFYYNFGPLHTRKGPLQETRVRRLG